MSEESEFIDLNAEIKVFESMLKEDGYTKKNNTKRAIQKLTQDGKKITENKIENSINYNSLSVEEKKLIDKINQNISIEDSTSILQYGMDTQTEIARFSDTILKRVKNKGIGKLGNLLTNLVVEIKNFDSNVAKSNNNFLNFFKNTQKRLSKLIAEYKTIENNIDKIEKKLEDYRIQMLKDVVIFDEMYEENLEYIKVISLYIIGGDKKIEELTNQLKTLKEKANQTKNQLDIQKVNDMKNTIDRFEKKINDLKITRIISIQMISQIRLLQTNESELIEKIQSSLTNTIPLWKTQIVLALGNSTIDLELFSRTNQNILEILDKAIKIHSVRNQKRLETEKELLVIEKDLKQKLYEI